MSTIVGWREWCGLPEFDVPGIKAKIDTGARTSVLHTTVINPYILDDMLFVEFCVRPHPRVKRIMYTCCAKVVAEREVRDSGGHVETRFFIHTPVTIGGVTKMIECSLTPRHNMRFMMLLGRTALKEFDYLVDPTKSYLMGVKTYRMLYKKPKVNLKKELL